MNPCRPSLVLLRGLLLELDLTLLPFFYPNPLRNQTILLLFLGLESFDSESLVRRHGEKPTQAYDARWWREGEEEQEIRLYTGTFSLNARKLVLMSKLVL